MIKPIVEIETAKGNFVIYSDGSHEGIEAVKRIKIHPPYRNPVVTAAAKEANEKFTMWQTKVNKLR